MIRPALLLLLAAQLAAAQTVSLSDADALKIGKRIWQNECAGTVAGLTSWNTGEDFASLGIGHFIWYHAKHRGPFEESFPKLAEFLTRNGVKVPKWMGGECPWTSRSEFLAAADSARMKELREMLASTIALQARFCARRLEQALPKMLDAAPKKDRDRIRENFHRVAAQPSGGKGPHSLPGMYVLIDYVNFKGEGTKATERYDGQGWGLLQVLDAMKGGPPLAAFSRAADEVLTRRVANSPKARNEARWLPGWRNRVKTYAN